MKSKKAQEEIVGFVLIMVIVAVIMLIFLGLTIRKGSFDTEARDSIEIYQFLESSMEYTTDCEIRFVSDFSALGELCEECYTGNNCLNGENSCEALDNTLTQIFDSSWNVGPESLIKGYIFTSSYKTNLSQQTGQEIISLEKGECKGSRGGSTYIVPAFPGRIENRLDLCY